MAVRGGENLRQKLAEYGRKMLSGAKSVDVGFLENATPYANGMSTASVAAIQEFGAPAKGIPPRPFFRTMVAKHKDEWGKQLARALRANGMDGKKALGDMGQIMSKELQDSITELTSPALSPVTLLLRQRFGNNPQEVTFADVMKARHDIASGVVPKVTGTQAHPLVWTGHLRNSADYKVNG